MAIIDTSVPHGEDITNIPIIDNNGADPVVKTIEDTIDPAKTGGNPPANPDSFLGPDFKMPENATPAYKSLVDFAKVNKIDIKDIKPEEFNAKMLEEKITDFYFQKKLETLDPSVKTIIDGGIPPAQYFEQVKEIDELLSFNTDQLLYVETFQKNYDSLSKIGIPGLAKLYTGTDTKLTDEEKADAYIDSITEAELAKMTAEQKSALDVELRANLKAEKDKMVKPTKPVYNPESANKFAKELSEKIVSAKEILNVDVDSQAYQSYVNDLFAVKIENDMPTSKFQQILSTDSDAMRLVTTILFMKENNLLTDLKNFYENKALEKLGVGSYTRQTGNTSIGRKWVDTSKPH